MKTLTSLIIAVFLAFIPLQPSAAPVGVATQGDVKVTFFDDVCRLSNLISLPYRATWEEKGKVFEGCHGPTGFPVAVLYFKEDKSIALIPLQAITPLKNL